MIMEGRYVMEAGERERERERESKELERVGFCCSAHSPCLCHLLLLMGGSNGSGQFFIFISFWGWGGWRMEKFSQWLYYPQPQ